MSFNLNYVYTNKCNEVLRIKKEFIKKGKISFDTYLNATVFPIVKFDDYNVMLGRGGVVDSKGIYIDKSKLKYRMEGVYEFETKKYIDKRVVFCGYFLKQWGHFITESVCRLWYSLKNDDTIDAYVFVVDYNSDIVMNGNYMEFLKLLGISDKVILINEPTKFKEVVIPEPGYLYGEYYTDEFLNMYDHVIEKGKENYSGPYYDKIFFTKTKLPGSVKTELNAKTIDKFFRKNGFEIISPEKLSLSAMIGVLQNASIWGALTSSAAHNGLFGKTNQKMIAVEKQAFFNPYQIFIGEMKGYETIFIDAYRYLFPVETSGPFWLDYTQWLDKYAVDNNMIRLKKTSYLKSKHIFKKYMTYYFDLNIQMPPDWVYLPTEIATMREAYSDTIKQNIKVFRIGYIQRIIVKLKRIYLSWRK